MIRVIIFLALLVVSLTTLGKPTEILFWHSMAGSLGKETNLLVKGYNQSQHRFFIKAVYKGEYSDLLTSFAAAFRANQSPSLIQVFEVGTGVMLIPGVIKPFAELAKEYRIPLPSSSILTAILSFYSVKGQIQALPFNTSIPVMFYNADLLAKININEKNFPQTWQELEVVAKKLKKLGFSCTYTSSYPSWIHIESFSALNGLPFVDANLHHVLYNNPLVINHLQRLKNWQTKHYFEYGGRTNDATMLFTSGHCAILSHSSGSYTSLLSMVSFHLGTAPLPVESAIKKRSNNVSGGAALWAVAGHSKKEYEGIAGFYNYLLQQNVQKNWYNHTGYLPFIDASKQLNLYSNITDNQILTIANYDLKNTGGSELSYSKIPQNQIRILNDEMLEAIFSGIKSPHLAIKESAKQADLLLLRFKRNTTS